MATQSSRKYALITGGTSDIGYELARLFAKDGYNLIIVARTISDLYKRAHALEEDFGVNVLSVAKDLFQPNAPFELYEDIKGRGLVIDALVNDAGQVQYGLFAESNIHRQLDIIQLNVSALTALTYLFLQGMIARNSGKILNLASIASQMPAPRLAVYHATKAYVRSFTEALRFELADTAIHVTALQPGATETDFFNKADTNDSRILDGGLSDPAQVAADGYRALLADKDKGISGAKNKLMAGIGNILPEDRVADQMKKMQEPKQDG
ncbi:SDR family oxidoreductase [Flaviaesturariibacter flavus]|uniref:SDR family oxidoreductase n=1 Tax=Flaviaesturariibacter flavus TaxID=2502780 RepID=A0A4R1BIH4_9BACT|nr:SDR family oxidoreductase [Flaviaesturariibacter flavus]TCJ17086.1 SDR family oxidoreductase [Flaviaesturariibacter flavus]